MKTFISACSCALLLSACASQSGDSIEAQNPAQGAGIPLPPQVKLPISADKWTLWQCQDGSRLETRLSADGRQLQLRYQGREAQLQQAASARPAIFENTHLAFFSDGKTAAVGHPHSSTVLSSGCRLGELK